MPEDQKNILEDGDVIGPACQKALAETSKALKAFAFYPDNHPLRQQILNSAYQAVTSLTRTGRVSLVIQRGGFSLADRQDAIENNPVTKALARELFTRELQRLTFLPEISPADFSGFLSILAVAPQKIAAEGGVAGMLAKNGIGTVMVNQIDVTAVYTKKTVGQPEDAAAADGAEVAAEPAPDAAPAQASVSQQAAELSIEELVAAMAAETDDEAYRQLARMLLQKALPLRLERNFDRLHTVLMRMAEQQADPGKSPACCGSALLVLQQLILGEMAEHLLDHLEDPDFPRKGDICGVFKLAGAEVVDAVIRRLVATGSRSSRKALGIAVVRIGVPAQPQLLALLKDGRVQVVQMAAALLGELGSRDAVKGLVLTAHHPDNRVRMESIRSLARIGGMEASSVLLSLVAEGDEASAVQAITWLGNCRNQAALQPLLQLVARRDLLGKMQALKKEALGAIGRIGDRGALPCLFKLVRKRHLIAPARRLELKLTAIEAIAALGGDQARAFLKEIAAGGNDLARAAGAALESLAQRGE